MGEVVPAHDLADPTSPIPSHCTSIVATSTLRVKPHYMVYFGLGIYAVQMLTLRIKATIHKVTTMLFTSKKCHNHLLTTGTDDPML